jgi:conjugal transfer pilus assembly protein TraF
MIEALDPEEVFLFASALASRSTHNQFWMLLLLMLRTATDCGVITNRHPTSRKAILLCNWPKKCNNAIAGSYVELLFSIVSYDLSPLAGRSQRMIEALEAFKVSDNSSASASRSNRNRLQLRLETAPILLFYSKRAATSDGTMTGPCRVSSCTSNSHEPSTLATPSQEQIEAQQHGEADTSLPASRSTPIPTSWILPAPATRANELATDQHCWGLYSPKTCDPLPLTCPGQRTIEAVKPLEAYTYGTASASRSHLTILSLLLSLALTAFPIASFADTGTDPVTRGFACDDARTRGWNFYCDPNAEKDEEPEVVDADPPAPPPVPLTPPKTYTEQIEEYRKNLDELKHRAILEPTEANVIAYMEAQAAMVRQAGLFTEVWQRSLFSNPALDANVDRPLSQIGSNLYQDSLDLEREAAFQNATSERALMFVYEGGGSCLVCETQGEVLRALIDLYGVSVLAVTRDGITLPSFPDSKMDQGEIRNLGFEDVPSPFLALVEPRSGQVDLIGAGLMTQDIVLDRIRIITAIPEGELYD